MTLKLQELCNNLVIIEQGLCTGEIKYFCPKMETLYKYGMPVDAFDDIIGDVVSTMQSNKQPTEKQLRKLLRGLNRFQKGYTVDVSKQIDELENYISESFACADEKKE